MSHPRLVGWGAMALGLAALLWLVTSQHTTIARQKVEVRAQTAQVAVERQSAAVTERVVTRTVVVTKRAQRAIAAVQHAPGADTLVPPQLAAEWAAGVDGTRNLTEAAR